MHTSLWDFESPLLAPMDGPETAARDYHVPVLLDEVLAALRPAPGMLLLDGTLGGGGHTEALLRAGADVIALDRDADAIASAAERLGEFGARLRLRRANFAGAGAVLDELGEERIGGALLDLGVSSHQLDEPGRGFSFRRNGPLDMRMDRRQQLTAADLVNTAPFEELARIFRTSGEEPKAARIASRIVALRERRRFDTTFDLVAAVESVVHRTGARHPATRVFLALRIAVNAELEALESALEGITARLAPRARFAVITFHSLEDRVVKRFFRERAAAWVDRPEWPAPRPNPKHQFQMVLPRPVVAAPEEMRRNPRARSARLRVAERIHHERKETR